MTGHNDTQKTRKHIYRLGQTGKRFAYKSGKGMTHLGYFEHISHPDENPEGRWSFEYDRFAQQDDVANTWVYYEALRLNEETTR